MVADTGADATVTVEIARLSWGCDSFNTAMVAPDDARPSLSVLDVCRY